MKMNCPNCDQHLDIPDELAGQTIDCPACGENFAVENAASEAPESGQSKLKFAQSPKKRAFRKNRFPNSSHDKLAHRRTSSEGLSEDISKGSPTSMHLASQLGGTSTPLRETAASSFSGPVTKVLIGVGIALFILFRMGGGAGGCMMGSTAKMQNELASIESDMVDGIQDSETRRKQVKLWPRRSPSSKNSTSPSWMTSIRLPSRTTSLRFKNGVVP